MSSRQPLGYVVRVDGTEITLNLLDHHRGMVAAHSQGVSAVTEIGSLLGIDSGNQLLVLKVLGVSFAEPKEAHKSSSGRLATKDQPLRNLSGVVVGIISRADRSAEFISDSLSTPALGAMVYPLETDELRAILQSKEASGPMINIGNDLRSGATIDIGLQELISQHVAVLGSSGQGKSGFTAAVLQQIVALEKSRTVIFDINGEYEQAFQKVNPDWVKVTNVGDDYKIPYYALGRLGLQRLLIPSEKTQRPALVFAMEHLDKVKWFGPGAGLLEDQHAFLFDDCTTGNAGEAQARIERLRNGNANAVTEWPHMKALSPLVAEGYSITMGRGNWERNAFQYSNVSPLINRINRFAEDPMFQSVINVEGGAGCGGPLDWKAEASALVADIFGDEHSEWRVHIVDLRLVFHDLMPFILGALLEMYAFELFRRGQDQKIPTLLVLEEAHHYLRPVGFGDDDVGGALAYERLAKEGRKFGLALWLSTQRPSEISSTVLSQCNNWISFKLNSEKDIRSIEAASEWADRRDTKRIAGLAKRNAVAFGGSLRMPMLLRSPDANPPPKSADAAFNSWGNAQEN